MSLKESMNEQDWLETNAAAAYLGSVDAIVSDRPWGVMPSTIDYIGDHLIHHPHIYIFFL